MDKLKTYTAVDLRFKKFVLDEINNKNPGCTTCNPYQDNYTYKDSIMDLYKQIEIAYEEETSIYITEWSLQLEEYRQFKQATEIMGSPLQKQSKLLPPQKFPQLFEKPYNTRLYDSELKLYTTSMTQLFKDIYKYQTSMEHTPGLIRFFYNTLLTNKDIQIYLWRELFGIFSTSVFWKNPFFVKIVTFNFPQAELKAYSYQEQMSTTTLIHREFVKCCSILLDEEDSYDWSLDTLDFDLNPFIHLLSICSFILGYSLIHAFLIRDRLIKLLILLEFLFLILIIGFTLSPSILFATSTNIAYSILLITIAACEAVLGLSLIIIRTRILTTTLVFNNLFLAYTKKIKLWMTVTKNSSN